MTDKIRPGAFSICRLIPAHSFFLILTFCLIWNCLTEKKEKPTSITDHTGEVIFLIYFAYVNLAAVSCSTVGYMLGGVKLGIW